MSTLEEFAAGTVKPSCKVCAHPRVGELHAARLRGVPFAVMARWTAMDADGAPPLGKTSISDHFRKGHATRG